MTAGTEEPGERELADAYRALTPARRAMMLKLARALLLLESTERRQAPARPGHGAPPQNPAAQDWI